MKGAAALPWVSAPSVPKCTWALHPLLLVEGTASQERQLRCLLRPGFGWVVVRACLLPLLAPRPRQPSGGHRINNGSNAALPTMLSLPSPFWSKPRVRSLFTSQNGGLLPPKTPPARGNSRDFVSLLKPPRKPRAKNSQNGVTAHCAIFSGAKTVVRVHEFRVGKT